jgi:AcrR family transcriptional regulator
MNLKKKDFKNLSRTQLLIISSLIELMKIDEFNKITITQIIQEADIARGTFYLNFKSKEDVIRCYIVNMISDYNNKIEQYTNPYLLCKSFFEYWYTKLEFLNLLQKHNLFIILLEEFDIYINHLSKLTNPSEIYAIKPLTQKEIDYFNSFNSAGLWHMLERWVKEDANETPEEMASIYEKFTYKG